MEQSSTKNTSLNRRRFLSIIAVSAAAGLLYRFGVRPKTKKRFVLRHSRQMMGTLVNFTLLGPDQESCQKALEKTIHRMHLLEGVLSRHQPDSNLSQLNREGELVHPDKALVKVISLAEKMSRTTKGAFDVTVLPLLRLYQEQKKTGKIPNERDIEDALKLVDYRQVTYSEDKIIFNLPGMGITLDGIGKGYIVDEGVQTLRNLGFDNIYLEAGGDLMVSGTKEHDEPWRIGIQNPRPENTQKLVSLELRNKAMATSGDYMQSFSPDRRYHHIINPLTGFSPPELASCTITAPTVAQADGLATAAMVLGPDASLNLLESLPECGGFLIGKDLITYTTTGFFG